MTGRPTSELRPAQARLRLLRRCGSGLAPGPTLWHERVHVPQARATGKPRQDVGQILDRIDSSQPAAPEDRVRDRGAFTACIRSRKEEIFASQGRPQVQAFDNAVVNRDGAVFEETSERDAVVGRVLPVGVLEFLLCPSGKRA